MYFSDIKPKIIKLYFVFYLVILIPFISSAQNIEDKVIYSDTTHELRMLHSISTENLMFLKICSDRYDCKGFITEIDTSGTLLNKMDIRATITRLSPFEFEIAFKYRNSKSFIRSISKIYCLNHSMSIAIPVESESSFAISPENLRDWDFIPASTDERDVVYILETNEKIILYQKIK